MNNLITTTLILLCGIGLSFFSACSLLEDPPCAGVHCLNGGTCYEGVCECEEGFFGENCEIIDPNLADVQELLANRTPWQLLNQGIPVERFYGMFYKDGYIFHLDTIESTGMIAANIDQTTNVEWGCSDLDFLGLTNVTECPGSGNCYHPLPEDIYEGALVGDGKANTDAILAECATANIAARLCRDLGEEWFLPSRGELNLMYINLKLKGLGNLDNAFYWSSSEYDDTRVWLQSMGDGQIHNGEKYLDYYPVRAVRNF